MPISNKIDIFTTFTFAVQVTSSKLRFLLRYFRWGFFYFSYRHLKNVLWFLWRLNFTSCSKATGFEPWGTTFVSLGQCSKVWWLNVVCPKADEQLTSSYWLQRLRLRVQIQPVAFAAWSNIWPWSNGTFENISKKDVRETFVLALHWTSF